MSRSVPALLAVTIVASSVTADDVAPPEKSHFHLYLLMGQSNMAGRGAMSDDLPAPERVLKYTKDRTWVPAVDPLHFDKPQIAGVGPGSGFGPAMAAADPEVTIGLIPCAFGGTPLSRWEPGADLYQEALARARSAAEHGTLKGVLWHQGESDTGSKELAESYGDRLAAMFVQLREDLGTPELPIVVGKLAEFRDLEKSPHTVDVNAGLEAITDRVPLTACVETTGLKPKSDGIHFDAESSRELGRRYAKAMLALQTGDGNTEDAKLEAYFREYLDSMFEAQPLTATYLGDHRFDAFLDDISPAARDAWDKTQAGYLASLPQRVNYDALTRAGQIDYEIFTHELRQSLWSAEHMRKFETDPRVYNQYLTDSVFLLLTQSTLPRERNLENCVARMQHMAAITEAARASLTRPPLVVTETAIRQNRGAIQFYEHGIYELTGETPQVSRLREACQSVVAVLRDYQTFLEKDLLLRSDGDWRIGSDRYRQKFELTMDAGVTADEVLAEAEREFVRVESELYVVARQLWGGFFAGQPLPPDDESGRRETIRLVLAKIDEHHGRPETLTDDARATVERIKAFITERRILTLPDPDRCQIIEMPEFQRGNSVAYLNSAPPLDPRADSIYAISPPPSDWSAERVESFLEEYNHRMLEVLTIHEAYPGHYVQLEFSNRHPSLLRKVLSSGVFAEGWAVYTEQMLLDQGFGDGDPALRMMQLKFYLRTIANAIIDRRLHCDGMTDEEALAFMMDRAFQTEGEAVGKLIRAQQTSCQLSTYFVGRMAFTRLRQTMQRELGDAFQLDAFHEAALAHGTLPVKYLPELVHAQQGDARAEIRRQPAPRQGDRR